MRLFSATVKRFTRRTFCTRCTSALLQSASTRPLLLSAPSPWAVLIRQTSTPTRHRMLSTTPGGEGVERGIGEGETEKTRRGITTVSQAELEKFRHLEKRVGLLLSEALPHRGSSKPLAGLRALDVGCGGGLLTESLARLGADVTGVDPSPENIAVASAHAEGDPLTRDVRYEAVTAEALEARGERFDLVASLEVIEHVEDPAGFVSSLTSLTRPGGVLALSTINRTAKSFALAIVGAEYLAGLVPVGTHDWHKFVPPVDLAAMLHARGFSRESLDTCGLMYDPLTGRWSENADDLDVNYIMTSLRSTST